MPPLRQRREEIPHLSTFFLREASERLGKPDVQLGSDVLDLFAQYWWPGNVRQLRNEIQRPWPWRRRRDDRPRAPVADLTAAPPAAADARPTRVALRGGQTLASVVDDIERDLIRGDDARIAGTSRKRRGPWA